MIRTLRWLVLTTGLLYTGLAVALSLGGNDDVFGNGDALLTVDEAIQVVPDQDWDHQKLLVSFNLAEGVYLYQHRLGFTLRDANGNELETFPDLPLPPGEQKNDEIYGDVQVYYHQLDVALPLRAVPLAATELEVRYQGCIENRLCYPPQTRTFAFEPPTPSAAVSNSAAPVAANSDDGGFLATLLSEDANAFNAWMHGQSLALILGLFFVGGLLLAFTPCVFPMVPILSGIIAGEKTPSARRGFVLSLAYVLGMAVPYTLAGLLVALFGAGLNLQFLLQQPAAIIVSAVIFVLLALSMFGLYDLQLPEALRSRLGNTGPRRGGGLIGAALMGLISGLVVSPCITPILAGALLYVAGSGDALIGAVSLFALAMGMGVPLLIFGTGGGHLLPRAGQWMDEVKRFFGVVMLAVAIWLLDRIVGDVLTLALYGVLLAFYGVQLGALEAVPEGGSRLKRALALVLALYGAIMLVGAAGGGGDPLQPLAPLSQGSTSQGTSPPSTSPLSARSAQAQDHGPWQTLTGRAALSQALAQAASQGKPVLVDFFAEWCVACKVLEETTLSNDQVLQAMSDFALYRVDITEINDENQRIMADYQIFGLPSLVFFDNAGNEVPNARVLGEMGPDRFLTLLEQRVRPALER
jgi:thiol:disulfide interchange protein DsbD